MKFCCASIEEMCIDFINNGDVDALSYVGRMIDNRVISLICGNRFYPILMKELASACNTPVNDSKALNKKNKKLENKKLELLRHLMAKCCTGKMKEYVVEALEMIKSNAHCERQLFFLLKSPAVTKVMSEAVQKDAYFFKNQPSVLRKFIVGDKVPALHYNPRITNELLGIVIHYNCEIGSQNCNLPNNKKQEKHQNNKKAHRRVSSLENLALWLDRHYSESKVKISEPDFMASCIVKCLDGYVADKTEEKVRQLLTIIFSNGKIEMNNGINLLKWCLNTEYSTTALMCFNGIELDKLVSSVVSPEEKTNLIKLLRTIVGSKENFNEGKEVIRSLVNSEDALDYIYAICPQLAACMVFKIEEDDRTNNPLRQRMTTKTNKPQIRHQALPLSGIISEKQ